MKSLIIKNINTTVEMKRNLEHKSKDSAPRMN